jgi:hypothetical protein
MISTNSRAARPSFGRSARNQATHGLVPRALLAGSLAFALVACAPAAVNQSGSGGKSSSGGSSSGGSGSGGSGSGGSNSGGSNNGGSAKGGSGSGGSNNGGNASGGSNNGGSASGGSANGGSANGGSASGGSGAPAGGSGAGGSSGSGTNPPGYWLSKDWNVTTADWHGCAWTGVDSTVTGSTTSAKPQDFTSSHVATDPYCVSGTVFNNYNSVALLGFNISEPATSSATQCQYSAANATKAGPPGIVPTQTGIAFNFSETSALDIRIQIQGSNGGTDATNRWCYDLLGVQSPAFAPFNKFNTKCWVDPSTPAGTAYANQPIDAVVFLVPGTAASTTPYNFCINGFAPGSSVSDAPKGGTPSSLTGTIGGGNTLDANFQRAKVFAGGHSYIIQNNNWGGSGSGQTINYKDNSFTITSPTGNSADGQKPASFPSIFIGTNGQVASGLYDTVADDNLPKVVNTLKSVQTTFSWTGGGGGKDFNAAYDVWFASTSPAPGSYTDGISGFVMVWLHKPANHQPIGSVARQATIAGANYDVWVGPRGGAGTNSAAPVVSYVAKTEVQTMTFDLNLFIKDAAASGIQSGWYLTDVFAGFEIWTGSDSANLQATAFTAVVQ